MFSWFKANSLWSKTLSKMKKKSLERVDHEHLHGDQEIALSFKNGFMLAASDFLIFFVSPAFVAYGFLNIPLDMIYPPSARFDLTTVFIAAKVFCALYLMVHTYFIYSFLMARRAANISVTNALSSNDFSSEPDLASLKKLTDEELEGAHQKIMLTANPSTEKIWRSWLDTEQKPIRYANVDHLVDLMSSASVSAPMSVRASLAQSSSEIVIKTSVQPDQKSAATVLPSSTVSGQTLQQTLQKD